MGNQVTKFLSTPPKTTSVPSLSKGIPKPPLSKPKEQPLVMENFCITLPSEESSPRQKSP